MTHSRGISLAFYKIAILIEIKANFLKSISQSVTLPFVQLQFPPSIYISVNAKENGLKDEVRRAQSKEFA